MDRVWPAIGDRDTPRRQPSNDFILPSRADAIEAVRAALEAEAGPVLVTGEAGVGKTWLWRRLKADLRGPWRWLGIDLSPAIEPAELYRVIGHGLGLSGPGEIGASRLDLADYLQLSAADGKRWVLVVDEAQNVSAAVLEEARILTNRLGHPDGFAALVLVGQSLLGRRLATRSLAALQARLSAQVHLKPLDIEEAEELVKRLVPGWTMNNDEVFERQHREAAGNPQRLIHWAQGVTGSHPAREPSPPAPAPVRSRPTVDPSEPTPRREPAREAPVLGPSRPPLRVEEGLIEVGWEPSAREMAEAADEPDRSPALIAASAEESESPAYETIVDHYAALQAWTEWAQQQGRGPGDRTPEAATATENQTDDDEGPDAEEDRSSEPAGHPSVWAEGQQHFAPYSQLFTRLKQPRES